MGLNRRIIPIKWRNTHNTKLLLQDRDWGQRVGYCLDLDGMLLVLLKLVEI